MADWTQNRHGDPHLLHLFAGDGVFTATMILAGAELFMTEGMGQELVISPARGFLYFERSNALTFCFSSRTDMGESSLLYGVCHDLGTNKFAEVGEVKGHGVIALTGLDIVGRVVVVVVTVVVGIRVTDALGSTRFFQLTSPCIASYLPGDPCFSLFYFFGYFVSGGLCFLG